MRLAPVAACIGQRPVALPHELLPLVLVGNALSGVQKADHGVVVVGARVHDAALVKAMRQVRLRPVGEGKRQHAHARKREGVAQRLDLGCHDAEIFGDERQVAQGFAGATEEVVPGRLHEASFTRAGRTRRNLPIAMEADEVVEADSVEAAQVAAQPLYPPVVSGLAQARPVVQGITPTLTIFAEVVGRHPRHTAPLPQLVEQEETLVLPDVGAVVRHEHGNVAEQQHAQVARVPAQALPLPIEQQLHELVISDFDGQLLTRRGQRCGLTTAQLGRPMKPGLAVLLALEGREQRVVGEPKALALAQLFQAVARDPGLEARERLA